MPRVFVLGDDHPKGPGWRKLAKEKELLIKRRRVERKPAPYVVIPDIIRCRPWRDEQSTPQDSHDQTHS